jgi:predicted RNA binding protein YcfA (HicA-like mRNA interferase family)
MGLLHNLKSEQVIRALQRAGWQSKGQRGSHVKLVKPGNPNILSIPMHKGKPLKIGLLKNQLRKAALTEKEFLDLL